MAKEIIAYIDNNKNAWVVWIADFTGGIPDMLMREYPLKLTRTEVVEKFKEDFGL